MNSLLRGWRLFPFEGWDQETERVNSLLRGWRLFPFEGWDQETERLMTVYCLVITSSRLRIKLEVAA